MHSGAIAARIIVATAPLGAMRVMSLGSSTSRSRLSVKASVSGSAAVSSAGSAVSSAASVSSAADSAVCSGAVCSVCAVSFAAVSCLPDAQPVMSAANIANTSRSARILLFIFGPPVNGDSEHRITMLMRLVKRFCDICPVKTKNILKHSIMSNAYDKAGARNRLKKTVARWQKCWYTIYLGE